MHSQLKRKSFSRSGKKMFYRVTPRIFISLFNLISQIAQIYFEFDVKVKEKLFFQSINLNNTVILCNSLFSRSIQ